MTLTALNGAGQAELTFYLNVINVFSDIPGRLDSGMGADSIRGVMHRPEPIGGSLLSFTVEPEPSSYRTLAFTESSTPQIQRLGMIPIGSITMPLPTIPDIFPIIPDIWKDGKYTSDSGDFAGFTLRNIVLERSESLIAWTGFTGSAELLFGEAVLGRFSRCASSGRL